MIKFVVWNWILIFFHPAIIKLGNLASARLKTQRGRFGKLFFLSVTQTSDRDKSYINHHFIWMIPDDKNVNRSQVYKQYVEILVTMAVPLLLLLLLNLRIIYAIRFQTLRCVHFLSPMSCLSQNQLWKYGRQLTLLCLYSGPGPNGIPGIPGSRDFQLIKIPGFFMKSRDFSGSAWRV